MLARGGVFFTMDIPDPADTDGVRCNGVGDRGEGDDVCEARRAKLPEALGEGEERVLFPPVAPLLLVAPVEDVLAPVEGDDRPLLPLTLVRLESVDLRGMGDACVLAEGENVSEERKTNRRKLSMTMRKAASTDSR